ncbi:MAG: serine hydrolase, partial [Bacteroidota bacterium]|nr:serine hydrolase [Bacteroidota bacterium]
MKEKLLIIILILFSAGTGLSQTRSIKKSPPLTEARPEQVGMSSERLARIDAILEEAVADGDIPGVVALIA